MATAEFEPYSLNQCETTPVRRTKQVKVKNREEEIQGGAVVTFVQTGKGNKKVNVYVQARKSNIEYFLFKRY